MKALLLCLLLLAATSSYLVGADTQQGYSHKKYTLHQGKSSSKSLKGHSTSYGLSLKTLAGVDEHKGHPKKCSGSNCMSSVPSDKISTNVQGSNNRVYGYSNTVKGDENTLSGVDTQIQGSRNIYMGKKSIIVGDDNKGTGKNNLMLGDRNQLMGHNDFLMGD